MSRNISLDIEACGEVVLSIGACEFDTTSGDPIGAEFYAVLDPQRQIEAGLKMDGGAFLWWLRQEAGARMSIADAEPIPPEDAFKALREWWPDRDARTWCYPTSYDLPVLARSMAAFHARPPWRWKETMCMRTLWKLACDRDPSAAKIEQARGELEHNALADAKEQAVWCAKYLAVVLP